MEAEEDEIPLRFAGELEPWWEYRKNLVARCQDWCERNPASLDLDLDKAEELFPPPAFCATLAAGSHWRCAFGNGLKNKTDDPGIVVVSVGGIYGGSDGPAGLFDYIAAVMASERVSFLRLDTGHRQDVALRVLLEGLRWLFTAYPQVIGRVVLAGFSMGSATVVKVGAEFISAICGVITVSGQSAGTERITAFASKRLLAIHGQEDVTVTAQCSRDLAERAKAAGVVVQLEIFSQAPMPQSRGKEADMLARFVRHHLWEQRWEVQAIVLDWLRAMPLSKVALY